MWLGRTVGTTADVRANSRSKNEHLSKGRRVSGEAQSQCDRRGQRGRFVGGGRLFGSRRKTTRTTITDRNERALRANPASAPTVATSNPPRAGPIARATLKATELSDTALATISLGTRSGTRACQAGRLKAAPRPISKPRATSLLGRCLSEVGDDGHRRGGDAHHDLGDEEHLGAFDEVGDGPRDEGQAQKRKGGRGAHETHPGRRSGQFEHQPGPGGGVQEGAEVGEE